MNLIINIVLSTAGIFVFLYFFWRKLKEDYGYSQIFSAGFYSLLGLLLLNGISRNYLPGFVFWASLIGSFLGLIAATSRMNIKIFEAIEAWTIGTLGGLFFIISNLLVTNFSLGNAVKLASTVFLMIIYFLIDKHYKKFSWYKSGRVGFTGLSTLGLGFTLLIFIAIFFPDVLSFQGRIDAIISGVLAFIFFLLLYNLSQKSA